MAPPPTTPGERFLFIKLTSSLRIVIVFRSTYIFLDEGEFSAGVFPWRNFPWGGKFPRSELVRGNYTLGGICQNSYTKFFSFNSFILKYFFTRGVVKSNFPR